MKTEEEIKVRMHEINDELMGFDWDMNRSFYERLIRERITLEWVLKDENQK